MTELEQTKSEITRMLRNLCARCKDNADHICPVTKLVKEIEGISGIPVIVNDRLWHVVFN